MNNRWYNDELYHYGVQGMKWGVRRYQNKDGGLTKHGKKKLNKLNDYKHNKSMQYKRRSENYKKEAERYRQETNYYLKRAENGNSAGYFQAIAAAEDYKNSAALAKEWLARSNAVKDLKVDVLMSKRDIRAASRKK